MPSRLPAPDPRRDRGEVAARSSSPETIPAAPDLAGSPGPDSAADYPLTAPEQLPVWWPAEWSDEHYQDPADLALLDLNPDGTPIIHPDDELLAGELAWTTWDPHLPIPATVGLDYLDWSSVASLLPPGPELAYFLTQRPPTPDPVAVGCDPKARARTMMTGIAARQRLIHHLESQQAVDLRELTDSYPGFPEFLSSELAFAIGMSETTAQNWLGRAQDTKVLHLTRAAWEAGRLSSMKVAVIRENLAGHTEETIAAVEREVLPGAAKQTIPQLRIAVQQELIRHDPAAIDKRHAQAAAARKVTKYALPDGMAGLHYFAPVEDVAAVWEALTTLAYINNDPSDQRGIDARRADVLRDLCTDPVIRGEWNGKPLPAKRARRALINVAMPAGVLMGSQEPCLLAGYGPITADQARRIASDADLRRLLCDPVSGQLIGLDRTKYRPPASLADFVRTRDETCVAPGCRKPAWRCEIDHRERFLTGGPTDPDNLACLCKHHHRAKDEGGFALARDAAGNHHWTTPLGHTTVRKAKRHWEKPNPRQPGTPEIPLWTGTRLAADAPGGTGTRRRPAGSSFRAEVDVPPGNGGPGTSPPDESPSCEAPYGEPSTNDARPGGRTAADHPPGGLPPGNGGPGTSPPSTTPPDSHHESCDPPF